ncbi:MAG: crossover junction endodeoxyribonuclease RuvC [Alphaproteobacteria bacterium]|nr:crossover junction endodeoxyribonuclease RuvC [Alphaproteobacteria bacterium]
MRVLGIDPGSTVTGVGVIHAERGRYRLVGTACLRTRSDAPMGERLAHIHEGLVAALREHAPDAVAIEAIFRHKSSESALRLGQARGVALLAAAQCGHEAVAYNPMVVKKTVGAHGSADKEAVARMVRMLLGVPLEGPADVSDALAIAITHAAHHRSRAVAVAR